ncbi:hypothetical protein [Mycolicibacterium lutetiense]|uniref:3-oxoacyl-ACP reductase-like protein n=1 Tax=Mycolicibacterium lutetiense TaxID=1641992 RepID=A0ABS4ZYW1_9MYCO|nr:hypothetical protein [Mycolicibacterium lutetiense]MBP2454615.1 3-oxoacyl-ACP reductase-like protein [Mycolicibacterium lutetiense]
MNRLERDRLIASLTDDELEQLGKRHVEAAAPEDPTRQFLRAINAERDGDWITEVSARLSLPAQSRPRTFAQTFTAQTEPTR